MMEDEIITIPFVRDENESCVVIQDPLNDNSKMADVMQAGDVVDDLFDGEYSNTNNCKFKMRTM